MTFSRQTASFLWPCINRIYKYSYGGQLCLARGGGCNYQIWGVSCILILLLCCSSWYMLHLIEFSIFFYSIQHYSITIFCCYCMVTQRLPQTKRYTKLTSSYFSNYFFSTKNAHSHSNWKLFFKLTFCVVTVRLVVQQVGEASAQ